MNGSSIPSAKATPVPTPVSKPGTTYSASDISNATRNANLSAPVPKSPDRYGTTGSTYSASDIDSAKANKVSWNQPSQSAKQQEYVKNNWFDPKLNPKGGELPPPPEEPRQEEPTPVQPSKPKKPKSPKVAPVAATKDDLDKAVAAKKAEPKKEPAKVEPTETKPEAKKEAPAKSPSKSAPKKEPVSSEKANEPTKKSEPKAEKDSTKPEAKKEPSEKPNFTYDSSADGYSPDTDPDHEDNFDEYGKNRGISYGKKKRAGLIDSVQYQYETIVSEELSSSQIDKILLAVTQDNVRSGRIRHGLSSGDATRSSQAQPSSQSTDQYNQPPRSSGGHTVDLSGINLRNLAKGLNAVVQGSTPESVLLQGIKALVKKLL